jgi:hypothetical protein
LPDKEKGRPRAGLFCCENPGAKRGGAVAKIFFGTLGTFARNRLLWLRQWWTTKMRAWSLGLLFSAVAVPCLAQTVLKSEPLVLAPYEIAFVQDASCPVGKVLKVTGAIRGLHRRKACVTLAAEQASLAVATP